MRAALALAARGLGRVWPNPAVGCVLVKDGRVVGRGWTQPGGRPHAETEALRRAGAAARGATAYVSLEPCSHHGKTPPCAEALIAAGVARVVAALGDPDPRVNGRGFARLRAAGIAVATECCAAEAAALNAGFLMRLAAGRPLVTLKLASTLDGRIATAGGESQWITGEAARAHAQALRARHDAILVGSGTALADDPALTCRLPGMARRSPLRIVLDRRGRLPASARLAVTAREVPTWVVSDLPRPDLAALGVELLPAEGGSGAVLRRLGERGLTRLLVEGGGAVAASLLAERLVDRLVWFHAGMTLGADARPAVQDLHLRKLDQAARFRLASLSVVGGDTVSEWEAPIG